MRNPLRSIKRKIKYYKSSDRKYRDLWYSCDVDEHCIMIEPGRGETVSGNMFAILKEVETGPEWSDLRPFFVVTEKTRKEAERKIEYYGFKKVKLVERMSDEYLKLLATCKYFFSDNTYPAEFCKKTDQVLVNTWHGTPLKHMGKANLEGARGMSNVMRNFFMSDHALFPNDFTRDVFMNDYQLSSQFSGSAVMLDYPRNDALYNEEMRAAVRREQGIEDKRVYAYMPTWRGSDSKSVSMEDQEREITGYLAALDGSLADDQLLFVNLHPFVGSRLSYDSYKHIRPFPGEYETYDFLNATDALITDYSSVLFDYAGTGRKIVLFTYDLEDYLESRGMYLDIRKMPFDICRTPDEVIAGLNSEGSVADKRFLDTFCAYRRGEKNCSRKLLEIAAGRQSDSVKIIKRENDGRARNVIAVRDLSKGVTNDLKRLIQKNTEGGDHVSVLFGGGIKPEYIDTLKELDTYENVDWYPLIGGIRDEDMPREVRRVLPGWHIDNVGNSDDLRRNYHRLVYHLIPVRKYAIHDRGENIRISFLQDRLSYLVSARVGERPCELQRRGNKYFIDIPKEDLTGFFFRNRIALIDEFGEEHRIISGRRLPKILSIIHTKVIKLGISAGGDEEEDTAQSGTGGSICYLQEYRTRTDLLVRPANYTDSFGQRVRIALAYCAAKLKRGGTTPILLYEKNSERYEESASVLFEKLLDMGYGNVYYVIRKDCPAWNDVPDRYRSKLLAKYSFRHYLMLFRCRTFIATERITHNIDLRPLSPFLRYWLVHAGYNFVFLQHGVMYMVSLDAERRAFFRLRERPGYKNRIVTSSELEADHFVYRGGFDREELYVCGLLKFDRAERNETHDRIVIMPTWRPGEANLATENFRETTYFKFIQKIYDAVPDDLKDKVVVLPHPLIKKSAVAAAESGGDIGDRDVIRLMLPDVTHEETLRMTDTLITDYSSISYDAFYRGANVIFDWEEKDDTIAYYGKSSRLMLTEDLAFGEVAYDKEQLRESIIRTYGKAQKKEHIERFRKIVTYHDGRNTERFIEMAKKDGLL